MAAKSPASSGSFAKVLRAYETGGFTSDDVLDELKKLLDEGVSRAELFAVLQRRDFLEPLPGAVHAEILAILHDGMKKAVAESVVFSDEEPIEDARPSDAADARTGEGPSVTPVDATHSTSIETPTPTPTGVPRSPPFEAAASKPIDPARSKTTQPQPPAPIQASPSTSIETPTPTPTGVLRSPPFEAPESKPIDAARSKTTQPPTPAPIQASPSKPIETPLLDTGERSASRVIDARSSKPIESAPIETSRAESNLASRDDTTVPASMPPSATPPKRDITTPVSKNQTTMADWIAAARAKSTQPGEPAAGDAGTRPSGVPAEPPRPVRSVDEITVAIERPPSFLHASRPAPTLDPPANAASEEIVSAPADTAKAAKPPVSPVPPPVPELPVSEPPSRTSRRFTDMLARAFGPPKSSARGRPPVKTEETAARTASDTAAIDIPAFDKPGSGARDLVIAPGAEAHVPGSEFPRAPAPSTEIEVPLERAADSQSASADKINVIAKHGQGPSPTSGNARQSAPPPAPPASAHPPASPLAAAPAPPASAHPPASPLTSAPVPPASGHPPQPAPTDERNPLFEATQELTATARYEPAPSHTAARDLQPAPMHERNPAFEATQRLEAVPNYRPEPPPAHTDKFPPAPAYKPEPVASHASANKLAPAPEHASAPAPTSRLDPGPAYKHEPVASPPSADKPASAPAPTSRPDPGPAYKPEPIASHASANKPASVPEHASAPAPTSRPDPGPAYKPEPVASHASANKPASVPEHASAPAPTSRPDPAPAYKPEPIASHASANKFAPTPELASAPAPTSTTRTGPAPAYTPVAPPPSPYPPAPASKPLAVPTPPADLTVPISPAVEESPFAIRAPEDAADWSDIRQAKEEMTQESASVRDALMHRKGGSRGSLMRVVALTVALVVVIYFAWHMRRQPAPPQASTTSPAAPTEAGAQIQDCPTCAAMTVIPSGRFKQGAPGADPAALRFEKPLHWVTIGAPFALSTNPVTVDEFREFVTATGHEMQGCEIYDGKWKFRRDNNWQNPGFAQTGAHPVTCVSFDDANAYAHWLSTKTGHHYRLPSASEWEYAARAGGDATQPWLANGANACNYANVADGDAARQYPGWVAFACSDGYVNTSPVGSFQANVFGLDDMLGNVFQWTQDCWHADYQGAPIDGSARSDGDCSQRELRGGSWFTPPAYVRANYRNHFAADYRTSTVGIRLARDLPP